MNRHLQPMAAALLAVFSAPLACAQTAASASSPTALPEVTVRDNAASNDYAPAVSSIGKTPAALRDIPQTVTVINRAVLESQGAATLTDALRNVPGITLGAGEGGVIGDNINIRGYSARTDLFIDGMRDRGQYARDTFFLEAVEVLKGPSSMLFGRGSTGGVVNQVSKQPGLKPITEVGISAGTDSTFRTTADLNRPLSETSAFRVSAVAHTNESTRDVTESKRVGVAPSLRFGIGTPTEITISSVHQRRDDTPDYGFPFATGGTKANPARPVNQPHDRFYGYTDDRFDQDTDLVTARIEHKISPALTLRNQTQYSTARIDAAPTTISAAGARNRREREIDDRSVSNQTDLIARLQTGSVKHTLVTGVELGRDYYENQRYDWTGESSQNLDNPVYGPMPASAVRSKIDFTDNTADTFAVYANDTLELSKQWKLIGGLRWDRYAFDGTTLNDVTGAVTTMSQTDKMLSTRLGLIYQPNDAHSYYLSYGTSFNPSAETMTLTAANLNIKPEKNRSIEVGGKWDVLKGLSLNAALFRVEKTNARSRDAFNNVVGTGETRVSGAEFGVAGQLAKNWQIFGGYTYLDGKIVDLIEFSSNTRSDRSGNILPNTPKHSATLWSTYRIGKSWEVGGGAVYSSERLVNNANTAIIDGYTRFDATVAYLTKQYDLRLNLQNLTDKQYFDVASGGRATPATGRTVLATLTYRF